MSKSQLSMEFIMLIGLVFLVFTGFLFLMHKQFSELNEKKDYSSMYDLANLIKEEVLMASKVHDNYIRKFEMPLRINSKDYKANLEEDVLTIINEDNLSVTVVLPVKVKGNFIDKNEKGQMKHCITKNKFDGVRISRNQASIEPILDNNLRYVNGKLQVSKNIDFYVYVRINCLDNIKAIRFVLQSNNLFFSGTTCSSESEDDCTVLYQYDEFWKPTEFENPFFEKKIPDNRANIQYINKKLTISLEQKPGEASSGSGNIIKLKLRSGSQGIINIDFVELELVDIKVGKLTKEALPSSNLGAEIIII